MPVPRHILLRITGLFYGEDWSIGLRYRSLQNDDPGGLDGAEAKLADWISAIRNLANGAWVNSAVLNTLGASASVNGLRASVVGVNGREEAIAETILAGSGIKGIGQALHPVQNCLTVTLLTGSPGARNRGRVYLPAGARPLGADGLLALGDTEELAGGFASWIKNIGAAGASIFSPSLAPAVISAAGNSSRLISSVRVGNRFDVQRRRADSQQETYSTALIPQ